MYRSVWVYRVSYVDLVTTFNGGYIHQESWEPCVLTNS